MHWDIKPENLLYKYIEKTHLMLGDFGLASFWDINKYLFPCYSIPGF